MKNTYIFIFMLFSGMALLFSCTHNSNGEEVALTDSLINATEGIAIGKTKFGISEKEFNELHPDSLIGLDGNFYNITSYFSSSKELNMIYLIDTATIENRMFDEALLNRMEMLKQYFTKTYGVPQHNRGYPKQDKMQNGKSFDSYMWKVGKKKIFVGIALEEADGGNIYYVVAHVDRKDL